MASLTPTKSSAVLLVFAMMVLTYVHSAAIPQSIPDTDQATDHDLDSMKTQPAMDSEQSLEEALQSPQSVQDSSDKAVVDVVENDKNLQEMMTEESLDRELSDTDDEDDDDDDDDDDGDGDDDDGDDDDDDDDEDDDDDDDGNDVIGDDSEQELEDLRPGEPGNPPPPHPPASLSQLDDVSDDELQDEDIQENELREAEDSAREYEKALIQGREDHEESGPSFQQQRTQDEAGTAQEDKSNTDEEDYEGYGLDDDDDDDDDDNDEDEEDFIEISDVNKPVHVPSEVNSDGEAFQSLHQARILPSNTGFTPEIPESLSPEEGVEPRRPYLDDAIVSEDDVTHDDVKRGDETMKVRGHPALRVIELNETLYLNNTDDNEPKFRPVRIPDKFEDYDVNRDGLISLPEVRHVTRAVEGAREAFRDADRDGDGWVERDEFDLAGWGMQMNPSPTPPPTPPPQRRVVFVPREDLHPSSIPRGPDDVTSRRQYGRRRH